MAGPILSSFPEELFVDREELLAKLDWISREAAMPMKHNLCLFGRWRVGKTLLLLKHYDRLFHAQGPVIPIFYTLPRSRKVDDFSRGFITTFAQQYLAFKTRDAALAGRKRVYLPELINRAQALQEKELLEFLQSYVKYPETDWPLHWFCVAADLPRMMASLTRQPFLVMLDEFHRVMDFEDPRDGSSVDLRTWFQEPSEWWGVNWIITGSALKIMEERVLTDPLNGRFDGDTVGPLRERDALDLGQRVAAWAGAEMPDAPNAYLADHAENLPFYIFCIARTAAQRARARKETVITLSDITEAAAFEVTQGEIFRQLNLRFQEMFVRRPDQDVGRTLLYRFAQSEDRAFNSEDLARELGQDHEQIVALIDVLAISDLIDVHYHGNHRYTITVPDRILRRYLITQYERLVAERLVADIEFDESERLKQDIRDLRRINGILMESHLKMLMHAWSQASEEQRTVPGTFFGLGQEFQLPAFRFIQDARVKLPGEREYQLDAYAGYVGDEGKVGWVVESKFRGKPATKTQLQDLVRAGRALKEDRGLNKMVCWFFSASGFTEPARKYAQERGILISDLEQVNALLAHFGLKRLELLAEEGSSRERWG